MRQIDLVKLYSSKRCLVVDDMPDMRVAILGMLRLFGVEEVDAVANGEQAIEACANTQYQMVLCDYNLGPGKDGQQVLDELRHYNYLNNSSIFIMVTGESFRERVLGALEYRPDDYVTKPLTKTLLRERLNKVLLCNQELYSIKQAIGEKNYMLAERYCQDRLFDKTAYRSACLQIQAEMNFRLSNFNRAEDIYRGVLVDRSVLWAKLGLGKILIAKKEYEEAEECLKEVIADDTRVAEAYDLLADLYVAKNDLINAQEAMQDATDISPKSTVRLRRLASLAKINKDTTLCLEANRRAIKAAKNSFYESSEDYFNLARELTDLSQNQHNEAEAAVKEAFDVLQRLEKKSYFDTNADMQLNALKARSLFSQKKISKADVFLDKSKKLYREIKNTIAPEVSFDFAEALLAKGDRGAADEVLKLLLEKHPKDKTIAAKVDAMSDTPQSTEGRQKVLEMTKLGINFYEANNFLGAIGVFKNANVIFPGHVGLNLNLVQSIVSHLKTNTEKTHVEQKEFEKLCRKSLLRVSKISPSDSQYARYQHLKNLADELFI